MRYLLMPPNFQDLQFWYDATQAVDYVWADRIDNPQKVFPLLRDTYSFTYAGYNQEEPTGLFDVNDLFTFSRPAGSVEVTLSTTTDTVVTSPLNTGYPKNLVIVYKHDGTDYVYVPISQYVVQDGSTLKFNTALASGTKLKITERVPAVEMAQQLRFLGFQYQDTEFITRPTYIDNAHVLQMMAYNFGQYLNETKGTKDFMDFFGFCFSSVFQLKQLWSSANKGDITYGAFLPEGDSGIGTPTWKGGTWFPTSHVNLYYDLFLYGQHIDVDGIRKFFDYAAPINLVLNEVVLTGTISAEANLNMAIEGEMTVTWL